ncbi:MAG: hypothetical protein M3Y54_09155, partial [Bacteroidota bacterium]|nr:hypothetical protein [Bacteroidota bacterium]
EREEHKKHVQQQRITKHPACTSGTPWQTVTAPNYPELPKQPFPPRSQTATKQKSAGLMADAFE